ncbi:MAG: glutamine amidotransferase [Clostridiales bacterium]
MYEINICHLYPDLLNLYGDRGNIIALQKRSEWRGIKVNIHDVSINDYFDSEKYDIFFLGGGQDYEQEIIQNDFIKKKGSEIINAIEGSKIFLCICGGYQLLGKYYKTHDNKEIEFLSALDIWTIAGNRRLIGNTVYKCDLIKTSNFEGTIVGFENHSGKTYLGKNVKPLAKVLKGNGNNGEDGYEGAIYKNVICTYSHGSLLPKNPYLTDYILSKALGLKYKDFVSLNEIDTYFENKAHETMYKRILSQNRKPSHL